MATYSAAQEREAVGILSQIFSQEDRAGRIALAERFGYGGSDASKLRSLRRILAGEIRYGSKVNVTRFFKPFTTPEDKFPLRRIPELRIGPVQAERRKRNPEIQGLYQLVAQVMYVRLDNVGYVSFVTNINSRSNRNIPFIFENFNQRAADVYETDVPDNPRASPNIVAIAFSDRGTEELRSRFGVPIPRVVVVDNEITAEGLRSKPTNYGVSLVPGGGTTKDGYKVQSAFGTRSLPKSRRDDIIGYVRRVSKRKYGISLET